MYIIVTITFIKLYENNCDNYIHKPNIQAWGRPAWYLRGPLAALLLMEDVSQAEASVQLFILFAIVRPNAAWHAWHPFGKNGKKPLPRVAIKHHFNTNTTRVVPNYYNYLNNYDNYLPIFIFKQL